jgi:ribosomal protein S6
VYWEYLLFTFELTLNLTSIINCILKYNHTVAQYLMIQREQHMNIKVTPRMQLQLPDTRFLLLIT